jgi:dienelactone hydrolase
VSARADRVAWTLSLLAIVLAGCVRTPRPALTATDTGSISFLTAEGLVLSGDLDLPAGAGPFPAIVLMHGCGGLPHQAIQGWLPALKSWGYATFVVDSFGARHLREVCTSSLQLIGSRRTPDAYGALQILATHPRLDPERIALMGFSHGAIATLASATAWARQRYAAPGGAAFRAFFAFYPYCNATAPEQAEGMAAPVRIHSGALDDWTPAGPCLELARRARASGFDVEVTVYPNAYHAFDSVGTPVVRMREVENAAACAPQMKHIMGPVLNLFDLRHCMTKGATIGWNPEATEAARRNVRAQLAQLLK